MHVELLSGTSNLLEKKAEETHIFVLYLVSSLQSFVAPTLPVALRNQYLYSGSFQSTTTKSFRGKRYWSRQKRRDERLTALDDVRRRSRSIHFTLVFPTHHDGAVKMDKSCSKAEQIKLLSSRICFKSHCGRGVSHTNNLPIGLIICVLL